MPGGLKSLKRKSQRCKKNPTWIQRTESLCCSHSSHFLPRTLLVLTCYLPVVFITISLISDILGWQPFKVFKPKELSINKSKQNQSWKKKKTESRPLPINPSLTLCLTHHTSPSISGGVLLSPLRKPLAHTGKPWLPQLQKCLHFLEMWHFSSSYYMGEIWPEESISLPLEFELAIVTNRIWQKLQYVCSKPRS